MAEVELKAQEQRSFQEIITQAQVPQNGFAFWFLGQNAFILKGSDGFTIAIDPYLSDWCATRGMSAEKTSKSRTFPPLIAPEELAVDLILLTHSHCDHADPVTLAAVARRTTRILGPQQAINVAKQAGVPAERVRLIHAGEEVRCFSKHSFLAIAEQYRAGQEEGGILIEGTFALPTDETDLNHLGFLLRFPGGGTFWNTGDTAWCDLLPTLAGKQVQQTIYRWKTADTKEPQGYSPIEKYGPDIMAVCINAGYGNLSHWDAARLAGATQPHYVVPTHWDLFPHNSVLPEPFKTSLEKHAPDSTYLLLQRGVTYLFHDGSVTAEAVTL